MKKLVSSLALASAFVVAPSIACAQQSNAQGGILTGDIALACEAILCLSSGTQPSECGASIARYFGISLKNWSDTVSARRNFLNLCPAAQDTSSANMPGLINAIANGAGHCDAATLNRNIIYVPKETCEGYGKHRDCNTTFIPVVNPNEPAYCSAYTTNVNTYNLGLSYVGEPLKGGHWISSSSAQ